MGNSKLLLAVAVVTACVSSCGGDMADGEMGDHGDHSHDHGSAINLTSLSVQPEVSLVAEPDGSGGILLDIEVHGLELVPADAGVDHQPGEGHVHVMVDGSSVAMIAETSYHVTGLSDGSHTVMVTLSANDHRDYHADGKVISDMTTVVVTGGS